MTAIDTLLSQSFGAKNYQQYGALTGISLLLVFLATIVMSVLMALCGRAMHLFGLALHQGAGEFAYRLIPGLFPLYTFRVIIKWLQTQNILAPGICVGVFANVCNILLNWTLIFKAGWGYVGSAWAATFTQTIMFLSISVYIFIKRSTLKETMPSFSRTYLTRDMLKEFISLGAWGAFSTSALAWAFNVSTILTGLLGTVQLGVYTISFATFKQYYYPLTLLCVVSSFLF